MSEITDVRISRTEGSFNWCEPSKKEAQIVVRATIDGKVIALSDCVEIDSTYDYQGDDIIEAIDAIECAIARYLFYSGKQEFIEKLTVFRANETAIRKAYALTQAKSYQAKAKRAAEIARAYLDEAAELSVLEAAE